MFMNLSVRGKLMTIAMAIVVLFAVTSICLDSIAKRYVGIALAQKLERSKQVVTECFLNRYRELDAGLHSLVDSPEIRAVLTTEGIDHDTQLMSIIDLQHMLGADLVLYCDDKGKTLARTDDPFDAESMLGDLGIIAKALKGEVTRGFWETDVDQYLAIAFPVKLDDEVRGVVCAAVDLTKDASRIEPLLLYDVAITRLGRLVTASLDDDELVSRLISQGQRPTAINERSDLGTIEEVDAKTRDGQSQDSFLVAHFEVNVPGGVPMVATILLPRSSVYGFYDEFRALLLVLGGATLSVCLFVTFVIGAIISSQVRRTLGVLERVSEGDLDCRLDIRTRDEFGRIATALNRAVQSSATTLDKLAVRNRDMDRLLNSVQQGFFTIGRDRAISDERSGAVERIFGPLAKGSTLSDVVGRFDRDAAQWIELGLDEVFDGLLPVEVSLGQLPRRFAAKSRVYSLDYSPVLVGETLGEIVVVISDITAQVENEKLEANQRELLAMVHRLAEDRSGFFEFIDEANFLIEYLEKDRERDLAVTKRYVHTLKGNCLIYGLGRVAEVCHQIEDAISESQNLPPAGLWGELFTAWASVRSNLCQISGRRDSGIEISPASLNAMIRGVVQGVDRGDLAIAMSSWKLEPAKIRLTRVAEQMRGLAKRMGKGDLGVEIRDYGLRLEANQWSEFWAAFVHVVRNAVDHGVETPSERIASGKSAAPRIQLETSIREGEFVVAIEDDGRGIDWEKLTEAAYRKGLPGETREDLVEAMFVDGVTTADGVTDVSGRGIGMSAIHEVTTKLGGRISVDSERGRGTRFMFHFPIEAMAPAAVRMLSRHGVTHAYKVVLSAAENVTASAENETLEYSV